MTNVVQHEFGLNDCSNITVPSEFSEFVSTLYGEKQNLSLNSTNHLNGSVMTVQKSRAPSPLVKSFRQSLNSLVTPALNFDEVISSHSTVSLIKEEKEDSGDIYSMPVINTEISNNFRSETPNSSAANFEEVKLNNPTASLIKSEKDDFSEINSTMPVTSTKTSNTFTIHHKPNKMSDAIYNIPIEKSVSIVVNCGEVTIESGSRPCVHHKTKSAKKKKTETFEATSKNGPVFKTSLVSTGLQSGAYVQIKSPVKSSVKPMYISDSQTSFPSYESITMKDVPLDFTDIKQPKCSEASSSKAPVIVDVFSVKEEKIADDASVSQQNSHAADSNTEEDKDYQYLMGILPQLKELPKELKQKFKRDVQNLLTVAVIRGEKLKRKATETG